MSIYVPQGGGHLLNLVPPLNLGYHLTPHFICIMSQSALRLDLDLALSECCFPDVCHVECYYTSGTGSSTKPMLPIEIIAQVSVSATSACRSPLVQVDSVALSCSLCQGMHSLCRVF